MENSSEIKPIHFLAGNNNEGAVTLDLNVTPNLLVGGTSGTGKSVFLQQIIISLMTHSNPNRLRFGLIDSKLGIEFTKYNESPFMLSNAVTDRNKAKVFIKYIEKLMLVRYKRLRKTKTTSIEEYNQLNDKSWPYIVLVIDDFGDLITNPGSRINRPKIQNHIAKIAQDGDVVGIHVIVTVQKPFRDVLSQEFRSDFAGRVAFKTINQAEGYLLLGSGAFPGQFSTEKLHTPGECLISSNSDMPYKCQVPNITNPQIRKVIKESQKKYTDNAKFFSVNFEKFVRPNNLNKIIDDVYTP